MYNNVKTRIQLDEYFTKVKIKSDDLGGLKYLKSKDIINDDMRIYNLYGVSIDEIKQVEKSELIDELTNQILLYEITMNYFVYKDYDITKELMIELVSICYSFKYIDPYIIVFKNYCQYYNMPYIELTNQVITYNNEELKTKIKSVLELKSEYRNRNEELLSINIKRSKNFIDKKLRILQLQSDFEEASNQNIDKVIKNFNNHFVKVFKDLEVMYYFKLDKWVSWTKDNLYKRFNQKKTIDKITYNLVDISIMPFADGVTKDKTKPTLYTNIDHEVIFNLYIEDADEDFVQYTIDNYYDIFEKYSRGYRISKTDYYNIYSTFCGNKKLDQVEFATLMKRSKIIKGYSSMNKSGKNITCYIIHNIDSIQK